MRNKKVIMYISIILILSIVAGLGYLVYINLTGDKQQNTISEYTPQEEITDEQIRMTNIELFFLNKNTDILEKEMRTIDAKELIENPAKRIIELLLAGPINENYSKIIPENTKLNNIKLEKGVLYIDFSEEFIGAENLGKSTEMLIMDSIIKTMKQLLEINSIKILINGQENMEFKDGEVSFEEAFKIE